MPPAAYFFIGAVLLLLVGFFLSRRGATPSLVMWRAIDEAVMQLQRSASDHVLPQAVAGTIPGLDLDKMEQHTAHVQDTIRLVYTVEYHEDGFLHTVSSQLLRPKPQKYQIECMLVVMLTLNRQLGEAGINPEDVAFNIDQSELGTHFVYMLLSPPQHDQFIASLTKT